VIARDRGWRGEEKRNRGTDKWRADGCNGDLSGRESDGAGDQADKNRADFTLAAVVGSEPRGDTNEKRKGLDRERQQQPAQKPEADEAQDNADDDHGGGAPET
jgi:hypothetical protein